MLRAIAWLIVFHLTVLCWSLQPGNGREAEELSFWVDPWGRLAEIRDHFERKRMEHEEFDRFLRNLEKRLQGGLALSQATDQLLAYAEDFYPPYLHGLNYFGESGRSLRMKVAFNLIRHFQEWADRSFVRRLERELTVMIREGTAA